MNVIFQKVIIKILCSNLLTNSKGNRADNFKKLITKYIYEEIYQFLGLEKMLKTRILNKKFHDISKKIRSMEFYFDFLKKNYEYLDKRGLINKANIEVFSYKDLNEIFDKIDEYTNLFNKTENDTSKEISESVLKDLKIIILIKMLKDKKSLNLTFENILSGKEIKNYEAFIYALSFNDSVQEIRIVNFLWDYEEDFSFYNHFNQLFKYNKTLKKILIEGNILKENDLKNIKSSLVNNKSLEELSMNCSGYIKSTGFKKAFDDFQRTINLKKLSIKISLYTDCNNERMHLFSDLLFENLILKKLVIYRNKVDIFIRNMYDLLEEFLQIEDLNFRFESIPEDVFKQIMQSLMPNRNLLVLDVSHNNLTDKCVEDLCEYLRVNKKLRKLNLEKNNISDKGLKILSEILLQNNEIREIDISWNNFTDEGMKHFKNFISKSNSIEKIFLSREGLTEEGIKAIKEAFNENKNIKKIMMGIVNITR